MTYDRVHRGKARPYREIAGLGRYTEHSAQVGSVIIYTSEYIQYVAAV